MKQEWQKTIEHLQEQLAPHTFNTWIKPLHFRELKDHKVHVEVPNAYYKDRLQSTYSSMIKKALHSFTNNTHLDLHFTLPQFSEKVGISEDLQKISQEKTQERLQSKTVETPQVDHSLYKRYTFDQFVVGSGNQFAHAAAMSVAEKPGQQYNPLFLYGPVGLGKTHLLCAIGHEMLLRNPATRVVYETCEQFTNQMINAIRHQKTESFRSRYRNNCDLLLIDDVQFLSKKERTQEEFFHTFNVLHQQNIQIAFTADQLPKDMIGIDERLRSRFEWGLLCDLQAPDLETRVAILEKKISDLNLDVDSEVLVFLAEKFQNNIRSLEGALTRLSAQAQLSGMKISKEFALHVFSDQLHKHAIDMDSILNKVASFYALQVTQLKSASRKKNVALPRQIAMYLCRKHTRHSFPEIGQKFGGKDHTTIMHAFKKIEKAAKIENDVQYAIAAIEKGF